MERESRVIPAVLLITGLAYTSINYNNTGVRNL